MMTFLQLSIHSNSPIKQLNKKMPVSKINIETPNVNKHKTKNGSIAFSMVLFFLFRDGAKWSNGHNGRYAPH